MKIKNTKNFKGGRKTRDAPSSGSETHVGLYTDEETAFLRAVQEFQKRWGIKFLSHTHYLRILKGLGYTHISTTHIANTKNKATPRKIKTKTTGSRKVK